MPASALDTGPNQGSRKSDDTRRKKRWRAWAGWGVGASLYLFDLFLRLTIDVTTSTLQSVFQLGASEVSSAFASSFFYAYAVVQLPMGLLLDRLGPRITICLASLLCVIGCFLFSIAETVAMGTFARIIQGVGCGCGWLGALKVTRNSFGVKETLTVQIVFGITCMLGGLGGLVSQEPFNLLVNEVGWRKAYQVSAVIPVLIAIGSLLFVDDEASFEDSVESGPEEYDVIREVSPVSTDSLTSSTMTSPLLGSENESQLGDDTMRVTKDMQSSTEILHVLRVALTTPRLWLYALYISGTDAPYETFVGLWGVAFMKQVFNWSGDAASTATMTSIIVSTVFQLVTGVTLAWTWKPKMWTIFWLAFCGTASFVILILAASVSSWAEAGVVYAAVVFLGLSTGSITTVWSVISSDPVCNGVMSLGLVSGALNTIVIIADAVVQQIVGVVLNSQWDGKRDDTAAPVYSAAAFSSGFALLSACFAVSCLCAALLVWMPPKGGHVESGHVAREKYAAIEEGNTAEQSVDSVTICADEKVKDDK
eukprot:GFYU01017597.1.p1 GENE.GFYU01017597.1~~GFYU01017597.1.p1  ORF type:complete len:537 (-),score=73.76 GFYU01017597.1:18-1628(-)